MLHRWTGAVVLAALAAVSLADRCVAKPPDLPVHPIINGEAAVHCEPAEGYWTESPSTSQPFQIVGPHWPLSGPINRVILSSLLHTVHPLLSLVPSEPVLTYYHADDSAVVTAPVEYHPATCPFHSQPTTRPAPVFQAGRTVLENLQALERTAEGLHQAKQLAQCGQVCEAIQVLSQIRDLCPGSTAQTCADQALQVIRQATHHKQPAAAPSSKPKNQVTVSFGIHFRGGKPCVDFGVECQGEKSHFQALAKKKPADAKACVTGKECCPVMATCRVIQQASCTSTCAVKAECCCKDKCACSDKKDCGCKCVSKASEAVKVGKCCGTDRCCQVQCPCTAKATACCKAGCPVVVIQKSCCQGSAKTGCPCTTAGCCTKEACGKGQCCCTQARVCCPCTGAVKTVTGNCTAGTCNPLSMCRWMMQHCCGCDCGRGMGLTHWIMQHMAQKQCPFKMCVAPVCPMNPVALVAQCHEACQGQPVEKKQVQVQVHIQPGQGVLHKFIHKEQHAVSVDEYLNRPVTLHVEEASLGMIMGQIHKQTGCPVLCVGPVPHVSITAAGMPARMVLEQLASSYGLALSVESHGVVLRPAPATPVISEVTSDCRLPKTQKRQIKVLGKPVTYHDRPALEAQVSGLMKACYLAIWSGQHEKAADLARQAHALDPERVESDPIVYKLHLLDECHAGQEEPCGQPACPYSSYRPQSYHKQ